MIFNSIVDLLNEQLIQIQEDFLSSVEILLLQGIWQDKTYSEIAQRESYSPTYLTNVAAPKLYKKLSNLLDKNVTKKSCRTLLESYFSSVEYDTLPSYPTGAVPLDSPFYIKRFVVEEKIYQEISKPGALIRIKAPKETGKTSLLLRILNHASCQGYQTVTLNLAQIDCAILKDLDRFLRFLCASISRQLNLESKLDEYWDEDIGYKVSCSLYFRCYLLERIESPIVLAFDELNRIFEYPQVAKDVLPLLRSWYEEGKRTPSWQKLKLIVVYSTEVYVPLPIYQSPFNVGLPIELKGFDLEQVKKLAEKYNLNWQGSEEAQKLINLVGGHPGLIQIALYHLSQQTITLAQLLQTASSPEGIYYPHLRCQWLTLQQKPKLAEFFNNIVQTNQPLTLNSMIADRLAGMGLIKQKDREITVSCQLYQNFFTTYFVEIE